VEASAEGSRWLADRGVKLYRLMTSTSRTSPERPRFHHWKPTKCLTVMVRERMREIANERRAKGKSDLPEQLFWD